MRIERVKYKMEEIDTYIVELKAEAFRLMKEGGQSNTMVGSVAFGGKVASPKPRVVSAEYNQSIVQTEMNYDLLTRGESMGDYDSMTLRSEKIPTSTER